MQPYFQQDISPQFFDQVQKCKILDQVAQHQSIQIQQVKIYAQIKLQYLECQKGQGHHGQPLNLICFQPNCKQKGLICSVCMQLFHKKHKVQSLKLYLLDCKKIYEQSKPQKLNKELLQKKLNDGKQKYFVEINNFLNELHLYHKSIEQGIITLHNKMYDLIIAKSSSTQFINEMILGICKEKNLSEVNKKVRTILSLIPNNQQKSKKIQNLTQKQLEQNVQRINEKNFNQIKKKKDKIISQLINFNQKLLKVYKQSNIFTTTLHYIFSTQLHHSDITIEGEYIAKKNSSYNYHFALLQPSIQTSIRPQKVYFKIIQSSSSWVALGICHKQTVKNKNFGFTYSNIGHGGYLISSNGGKYGQ